jgi:hypothetical protein
MKSTGRRGKKYGESYCNFFEISGLSAMPTRFSLALVMLVCSTSAFAQEVPTIRARSRVVTITDGAHVKKNYWYVMPERSPDVYYVEIPRLPHTVTFTTDIESICI